MIQAAPLVISFARLVPALKKFVGAVGIGTLTAKVNEHIEENPEESAMILKTLVPNLGIGEIFMKKGKDEEVEEEVDIEDMDPRDLTDAEKRKIMRDTAKSGGDVREKMKEAYEKFIKPGQDRTFEEAEERYEGGLEDVKKPPFDYKRFFRKADGGAIGVESLFEERTPFRFGGRGYQGGRNTGVSRGGGRSAAMGMGGKQRGGTFSAPTPTGGGGPSGGGSTKKVSPIKKIGGAIDKGLTFISPFVDPSSRFGKGVGLYNLFKKGAQTIGNTLFTPAGAAEMDIEKQLDELRKQKGLTTDGGITGAGGTQIPNLEDPTVMSNIAKTAGLPTEKKKFKLGTETFGKTKLDYPTSKSENIIRDIQKFKRDPDLEFGVKDIMDLGFDKFNKLGEEKVKTIYDMVSLPNQTFVGADGGRVGFNVGGITDPAALAIYNSMNAYGFSDQEIADTITAQGYDAGTLGQTTTPTPTTPTPTTPTPSEGIIGIDLQQRDTGGGFNPFGPLQPTFTRPTGSDSSISEDAFFGLGKFFQGKERGTLGNRLQKQFELGQKLPSPLARIAGAQSPFNINSKNYNPDFADQLNYLEGMDGLIGMSSVGLKYGPESVLAGKNVISGFGSNNYLTALNKFIAKTKNDKRRQQGIDERNAFLAAEEARKEKEARERQLANEAERARLERLGRDKDRGGFDPTGPTQQSIRESRPDRSGGGGFTNPGKGSYGPFS
jgi:hypothetical protein